MKCTPRLSPGKATRADIQRCRILRVDEGRSLLAAGRQRSGPGASRHAGVLAAAVLCLLPFYACCRSMLTALAGAHDTGSGGRVMAGGPGPGAGGRRSWPAAIPDVSVVLAPPQRSFNR